MATGSVYRPVWSPDGRQFAYLDGSAIRVMGMSGVSHAVDGRLANGRTAPVWSPDSSHLAFPGDGDGSDGMPARDIWIVKADGTEPARPIRAAGDDAVVDWAPDGRLVTVSDQGMFVFTAAGPDRIRIWDRNLSDPGDLS